ncbi:hypothetical protein S101258_00492 [Lactiplantibacillus plantarum subsp. plantarum]|uniref:Uncharacterized protein n=1 Tax=Lactiplantibacillus plantarum subsp. plantarum TaxID=337330 RepID=A0A2S3U9M5_LACPN|nr:hypothetical protein S101258_00492 [Lactiplantibacillus plantarum subsp. plantarum]
MQHRIMQLLTIVVVAILALVPLTSGAMLGPAATTQRVRQQVAVVPILVRSRIPI